MPCVTAANVSCYPGGSLFFVHSIEVVSKCWPSLFSSTLLPAPGCKPQCAAGDHTGCLSQAGGPVGS